MIWSYLKNLYHYICYKLTYHNEDKSFINKIIETEVSITSSSDQNIE